MFQYDNCLKFLYSNRMKRIISQGSFQILVEALGRRLQQRGETFALSLGCSDEILGLLTGGSWLFVKTPLKCLPTNHQDVRSDTDVGQEWLLEEIKMVQEKL